MKTTPLQRAPAEILYQNELARLKDQDKHKVPSGWQLSPQAVAQFILGDAKLGIEQKFIGSHQQIIRIIISLITNRGAMLVGQPGTAKSWLSELLAAAISGRSTLILQAGAITRVEQMLYNWNQALINEKGPIKEALIATPLFQGMRDGAIVRMEELARSPSQIQDALLSILSERQISIPELDGEDSILLARQGFNIIGTSNTLDRGVNMMSAALKRRLNFETIMPVRSVDDEKKIVLQEVNKLAQQNGMEANINEQVIECLTIIFHELREGQSLDGRSTDRMAGTVMSTAEAVSVAHALFTYSYYYKNGEMELQDLVPFMLGAALKDDPEDRRRLRHYFETEIIKKQGKHWQTIYQSLPREL